METALTITDPLFFPNVILSGALPFASVITVSLSALKFESGPAILNAIGVWFTVRLSRSFATKTIGARIDSTESEVLGI